MSLRLAVTAALLATSVSAVAGEPAAPPAERATTPGITVQAQAEPKQRKVCHNEVATGSVMPKRVCRTVSTDPTERMQAERDLDRVRERQQYGQQMGDVH